MASYGQKYKWYSNQFLNWQNQQKPLGAYYNKYSNQYGLNAAESALKGATQQALKQQKLIEGLEGNINTRAQSSGMSEALRAKLYASEKTPLTKQYSNLLRSQESAQTTYDLARQRVADMMDLAQSQREWKYNQFQSKLALLKELMAYDAAAVGSSGGGGSRGGSRSGSSSRGGSSVSRTGTTAKKKTPGQVMGSDLGKNIFSAVKSSSGAYRPKSTLSNILYKYIDPLYLLNTKKKSKKKTSTSSFNW